MITLSRYLQGTHISEVICLGWFKEIWLEEGAWDFSLALRRGISELWSIPDCRAACCRKRQKLQDLSNSKTDLAESPTSSLQAVQSLAINYRNSGTEGSQPATHTQTVGHSPRPLHPDTLSQMLCWCKLVLPYPHHQVTLCGFMLAVNVAWMPWPLS